jgi:hypothetical protein
MRTARAAFSLSLLLLATSSATAQEFFAHQELDYWREAQPQGSPPRKPAGPERSARRAEDQDFRWEDYEDPATAAFWDDGGNYTPPRPLRAAAADPTPENVAKYLRWQKRKLETIAALQQEVARQLGADARQTVLDPRGQAQLLDENPEPVDWARVEILFFYASDCPHCQASVATVHELEQRGAKVIPVQTDWQKRPPLLPGSVQYTAEIAKEQPVDGVPLWVAGYGGDRLTMRGEVSVRSIEVTLKMAEQQKRERVAAVRQ